MYCWSGVVFNSQCSKSLYPPVWRTFLDIYWAHTVLFAPCSVFTITPRILLHLYSTGQTTCSRLPRGGRVALLLSGTPSTVSRSAAPDSPVWPLSVKRKLPCLWAPRRVRTNTMTCQRMWLKQNNSFHPCHGWCCETTTAEHSPPNPVKGVLKYRNFKHL